MVKLEDICDRDYFFNLVEKKLINGRRHPDLDLTIYKYSKTAPFEFSPSKWPEELLIARGLVLNNSEEIIARGFRKFFNYGEMGLPDTEEKPVIFDKADGSLIEAFFYQNELVFATLGSFDSQQAKWAEKFYHSNENHWEIYPEDSCTTIFEAIYPENRIVVNYGDRQMLPLLGFIDPCSGADLPIPYWMKNLPDGFMVKSYDLDTIDEAMAHAQSGKAENQEGIVLCWYSASKPAYRLKVKNTDYLEKFRLMYNLNARVIWGFLANHGIDSIHSLMKTLPIEVHDWAYSIANNLVNEFLNILDTANQTYKKIITENNINLEIRKDFAFFAVKEKNSSILFKLLDKQSPDKLIWELIKPSADQRPYLTSQEEG